jgi:predicted nucleotidyltransferase
MNFERAVQALNDAGVDFIIIGGWSAILHGSAQVSNDLDIFFSRAPKNL